MSTLADRFLKYDMFPLGDFENGNIVKSSDWYKQHRIIELDILADADKLLTDFESVIDSIGNKYVSDRTSVLESNGFTLDELMEAFKNHGFSKDTYNSFPLHKFGSGELLDDLKGTYTEEFFKQFNGTQHRQQYSVSYDGCSLAMHKDHAEQLDHGFRLMTPINNPAYFGFIDKDMHEQFYRLEPGKTYYVDVTQFHRAFSFEGKRILLRWQSNTDKNITGVPLQTYDVENIPVALRDYTFDKEFWGMSA